MEALATDGAVQMTDVSSAVNRPLHNVDLPHKLSQPGDQLGLADQLTISL